MNKAPMAERSFGYSCRYGTEISADRCDFKNGLKIIKPEGISELEFASDMIEFSGYHAANIHPELMSGFQGYDCISLTIEIEKD